MKQIIASPQIHFRKPVSKEMCIMPELLNKGLTFDRIIQDDHPHLKKDDIHKPLPCCQQRTFTSHRRRHEVFV